ncbi:hypothetical protein AA309_30670 [Microvirga vignae]|uniref:Uncharacterized protein n=1 Tax=Microvirga vignae TaxID=1225564 RepID=A0A0H1R368_9HYPH|nr:hypothetical protein AA309_30670 [Microvirga vignae]
MDHLCEDGGDIVGDRGAEFVGQAFPEVFGSYWHGATPHSSARAISSSSASRVSLHGGSHDGRRARLVAAIGSFSTMRSR